MSIPKHDKFAITNVIDLGTEGRFGPGREAEFAEKADDKIFKHCVDRGAITYPLITEKKKVNKSTASGSDAPEIDPEADEPQFDGTGDWRIVEGKAGWWRIIDPKGNFVSNKREDEAQAFIDKKNSDSSKEE